MGLGFDLAARREPDLLRSMQLTALKERLLVAFREQAERRAEFRAQERVYVEAIRVGLMEPLEPPVKQR